MKKRIIAVLLLLSAAVSLFTVNAAGDEDATHISAVLNKNGQYVEITGSFSSADVDALSGAELFLFAVAPGSYIGEEPPVERGIKARKTVSIQTSAPEDMSRGYVLATENNGGGYAAVSNYAYISNPDAAAENTYDYPAVSGKKGLDITLFADAQLLGASHTVIKVPLNEYISAESGNSVTYRCLGAAYHFDKTRVAVLDHLVKTYSEAGIRVYLQFVLTKKQPGQEEYLYFPNVSDDAEYYAISTSRRSLAALYAFTSFLAEKYTGTDRVGFCGSIIVGSEVNSNRYKNNAGSMSLPEYVSHYAKALRTVDAALRSVYSNGRVYVSVANNFNKPSSDGSADPTLDFSVMDFLSQFSENIRNGGNIPWRVSADPYNADRNKADFRDAEGSEYGYDAQYLTMDNINILTSLLSQPAYLYNGERRPVIIGEISYPSKDNSSENQKAQAAAYCLAYYKAEANGQIEAIIYAAQVDSADDGLNPGLYTRAAGTENAASEQKSIYRVFRYIDTDFSNVITEPYLSYYGLISWGEAVSGYSASAKRKTVISGSGFTDEPDLGGTKLNRLTDFNGETLAFYPSENAKMITTENDAQASTLFGSRYSLTAELNAAPQPEYRGVSASGEFDVSKAEYAVLDMRADNGKEGVADVMLRLTGKNADGGQVVYEGVAAAAHGEYQRLYFNLTEFRSVCEKADRLSVWVKPHGSTENGEYKLLVNGVSTADRDKKATTGSVVRMVIIVVICIVALAAAAYGIMYLRAYINYRKKKKRIEEKRRKAKK